MRGLASNGVIGLHGQCVVLLVALAWTPGLERAQRIISVLGKQMKWESAMLDLVHFCQIGRNGLIVLQHVVLEIEGDAKCVTVLVVAMDSWKSAGFVKNEKLVELSKNLLISSLIRRKKSLQG